MYGKTNKEKSFLITTICLSLIVVAVAGTYIHKRHVEKLAWEQLYNEYLDAGFRPEEIPSNKKVAKMKVADIEEARRALKDFKAMKEEPLDTTVHWSKVTVLE